MFASAFGSFDPKWSINEYHKLFEEEDQPPDPEAIEEFVPESAADVQKMMAAAFRAGVISPSADG